MSSSRTWIHKLIQDLKEMQPISPGLSQAQTLQEVCESQRLLRRRQQHRLDHHPPIREWLQQPGIFRFRIHYTEELKSSATAYDTNRGSP